MQYRQQIISISIADATVNVKISNNPEKLRLAAENFLTKTQSISLVLPERSSRGTEIVGK